MKIAIVGAGFAGVALAYYLSLDPKVSVTVIDKGGIASGASGASCGLMHAYVGMQVRRSQMADEAFDESKRLIELAQSVSSMSLADFSGIQRIAQTDEQKKILMDYASTLDEVSLISEGRFLLHKGATVQPVSYLNSLWKVCENMGARFEKKMLHSLSELDHFDGVVLACGAGIFDFETCKKFRLDCTKGQALQIRWPSFFPSLTHSIIAKGYVTKSIDPGIAYLGSTFERGVVSPDSDLDVAKDDLLPKFSAVFPDLQPEVIGIKSGVRVSSVGHYFPLIGKVSERLFLFTGLGSRGLLYHALFAKMLSKLIITADDSDIPTITKVLLSKNKSLS